MEQNNIEDITEEQMKGFFRILEKEFNNILNLINNIVDSEVFKEFRKYIEDNKLDNKQNTFKKTESILYSYNSIKEAIKVKEDIILEILENGLPEKSKSIVLNMANSKKDIDEVKQEYILTLKKEIIKNESYILMIDKSLEVIKDDEYFKALKDKYINKKSIDEIANDYKKNNATISRNINKLINKLIPIILTNLYLEEIYYKK